MQAPPARRPVSQVGRAGRPEPGGRYGRRVLARPTVAVQSNYGALSAYIIIGLMFAAFFAAIWHLGAGHFSADGQPANSQTFQYRPALFGAAPGCRTGGGRTATSEGLRRTPVNPQGVHPRISTSMILAP
jgi:hypothetical protein